MTMGPGWRRLARTAHVTVSVGWLGAVGVFLALGIVGMASGDERLARAAYLVMEPTARFVLVPLAVASLLTGLVGSLGTRWGLFRHYWVLFKLVINAGALVVLLMYLSTLGALSDAAASGELGAMRASPTIHSALALALLLGATVLAVYKPRGLTGYGRRRQGA